MKNYSRGSLNRVMCAEDQCRISALNAGFLPLNPVWNRCIYFHISSAHASQTWWLAHTIASTLHVTTMFFFNSAPHQFFFNLVPGSLITFKFLYLVSNSFIAF